MLYNVRHQNGKHVGCDALRGNSRLWQIVDGLKSPKGPKEGTCPLARAMMFALEERHAVDEDDLRVLAAALIAFRAALRSVDSCAKPAAGKFDMDCVLRVCDVVFKQKGRILITKLLKKSCPDEVQAACLRRGVELKVACGEEGRLAWIDVAH